MRERVRWRSHRYRAVAARARHRYNRAMSAKQKDVFDQLAAALRSALPNGLTDEVSKNLHAALRSVCERLELVTREELEVQEAVLQRTRAKVEQLEEQLSALEREIRPKA